MSDDRRADPSEQGRRDAESDTDAREHHHETDVPNASDGVDVGNTEQHPLENDHDDDGSRLRKPRITTPRNTISSTIGAAITAVITNDTT